MSYQRKTRYEYQIKEWNTHLELEMLLNHMCNSDPPWRVEHHRLNASSTSGWTVFLRYISLNQPLLERNIRVSEIYNILNRVLDPGSEQAREFDAGIKAAVRQELDDE